MGSRGVNVTNPPLEIRNLFNNTNYTFSVTALNEVSSRFEEEEWKAATIAVYIQGNVVKATPARTGTDYHFLNGSDTYVAIRFKQNFPVHLATSCMDPLYEN